MKGFLVLVAAIAIGYYSYKALTGAGEAPTCKEEFNHCMQTCRQTTTETAAAQACQDTCRRNLETCGRK